MPEHKKRAGGYSTPPSPKSEGLPALYHSKPPVQHADDGPPNDVESERSLLSCVVLLSCNAEAQREAIDGLGLTVDSFYDPSHQIVFRHIVDLRQQGFVSEVSKLYASLKGTDELTTVGGIQFLTTLCNASATAVDYRFFANKVAESAMKRRAYFGALKLRDAALNGCTADRLLEVTKHVCDDVARVGQSRGIDLGFVTLRDLMGMEFDYSYFVKGILSRGQPCLLLGGSKTLKTSIAVDLAVSISTGGYFLGRYQVENPARVLMFSAESKQMDILEIGERVVRAANREREDMGNLKISELAPQLASAEYIHAIRKEVLAFGAEVVIFDPLYFMLKLDGRESSLFAVAEQLNPITALAKELNVTIIMLHHTTQSAGRDGKPVTIHNASWAGFQQWAGQWIILRRLNEFDPDEMRSELELTAGGRAGHSTRAFLHIDEKPLSDGMPRRWDVQFIDPEDLRAERETRRQESKAAKHAAAFLEVQESILKALRRHPDGMTRTDVYNALGQRRAVVGRILDEMLATGEVCKCSVVKKTGVYDGIMLPSGGVYLNATPEVELGTVTSYRA